MLIFFRLTITFKDNHWIYYFLLLFFFSFFLISEISSVIYDNQEKKWECLDKPNRIQNCYALLFNDTVYFSSELDEIANFYEKIKSENNTLYSPNILDKIEVNHVKEYMQLQETALCDLGNNFYTPDFETIAISSLCLF